MNQFRKEFKGDPYWSITKFDVGRGFYNPDYTEYLENRLKDEIEKVKQLSEYIKEK